MREIWIIAKRELSAFFDSLVAYILLAAFLAFAGYFTWLGGSDIFFRKQADLRVFFPIALWVLFFFIPALTMKQLAEEKKTGTIELLLTKPLSDRQVIVGKFLACFLLVAIALMLTLPYYYTVSTLGNIDHGATIAAYLGLLLVSASYISIGIFASSLTNNQIVAFLLALLIGICFHFLFGFLASSMSGALGAFFNNLSVTNHFESIARGVIDSKDIIFFLSLTIIGLLFSEVIISKRK